MSVSTLLTADACHRGLEKIKDSQMNIKVIPLNALSVNSLIQSLGLKNPTPLPQQVLYMLAEIFCLTKNVSSSVATAITCSLNPC